MQEKERVVEKNVNGCHVCLVFAEKPMEGVLEKVCSVLTNAYEERVQKEMRQSVAA